MSPTGEVTPLIRPDFKCKLLQTCFLQGRSLLLSGQISTVNYYKHVSHRRGHPSYQARFQLLITTNMSPTGEVTPLISPDFNCKFLQTCLPQERPPLLTGQISNVNYYKHFSYRRGHPSYQPRFQL